MLSKTHIPDENLRGVNAPVSCGSCFCTKGWALTVF